MKTAGINDEMDINESIEIYKFVVDKIHVGLRIDKYLVSQLKHRSRTQIQSSLDTGRVTLNGIEVAKNHVVKNGEEISIILSKSKLNSDSLLQKEGTEVISQSQYSSTTKQKQIEKPTFEQIEEIDKQLTQKNIELKNNKVRIDNVEKELQETIDRLHKSERNLSEEKNRNILHAIDVSELRKNEATQKNRITKLDFALQTKDKEIQRLQSEIQNRDTEFQKEKTCNFTKQIKNQIK